MSGTKVICFEDKEINGIKAFEITVPMDWEATGSVNWVTERLFYPVTFGYTASKEGKYRQVFHLPTIVHIWSNNPSFQQTYPIGSSIDSMSVQPPVSMATDAIKNILVAFFSNLFSRYGLENSIVVSEKPLPQLRNGLKPDVHREAEGISALYGNIPVSYTVEAGLVDSCCEIEHLKISQEFLSVVKVFKMSFDGTYETQFWVMDSNYVFIAQKEDVNDAYKEFKVILNSLTIDPQWIQFRNQRIVSLRQQIVQEQLRQQFYAMDPLGVSGCIFDNIKIMLDEVARDPSKIALIEAQASYDNLKGFCDMFLSNPSGI